MIKRPLKLTAICMESFQTEDNAEQVLDKLKKALENYKLEFLGVFPVVISPAPAMFGNTDLGRKKVESLLQQIIKGFSPSVS